MVKFILGKFFIITFIFLSFGSKAQWSSTITVANDYLFNGVSQTDEKSALQAGLTWSSDTGFYLGSWSSNVGLAGSADIEVDAYIGYFHKFANTLAVDVAISRYSYYGKNNSEGLNYSELALKWNFVNTDLNFWYAWDYFGTGARHYIMMLNHTVAVNDDFSVLLGVDKSTSLDINNWQWQPNDKDYIHGQITALFTYQGFDLSLGIQATDLDSYDDTKLLLTLSKSFSW
jgi:uncharacterized protein (TIGR02001 family)